MTIYISKPERIDELFHKIEANPEDDYLLSIEFRENLVKNMRTRNLEKDFVQDWLDAIETDTPFVDGMTALCNWIYGNEFDAAQTSLDQFSEMLNESRDKQWSNLVVFSLEQLVAVKAELSGFTPRGELTTAVEILHEEYDGADVHLGNASRLINFVVELARDADNDTLEQALEYCSEQANLLHDAENFDSERNRLEQAVALAEAVGRDPEPFQNRITQSWDTERETQCEAGSTRDYLLLQQALDECQSFVSASTLKAWRAELQTIAPKAVEGMESFEFSVGIPDAAVDALIQNFEEVVDRVSMEYALFSLVQMRPHAAIVPKRDPDNPDGLSDVLPTKKISAFGTSTSTDYKSEYEFAYAFLERFVGGVFNALFDRDVLEPEAVVSLVEQFDGVDEQDIAFTNAIIEHLLRGEHVAAFHIGIPHFERVLLKLLNQQGESILVEYGDETRTNSLGTLIEKLRPYMDEEYVSYLAYMYTDQEGQNRRNLTAHGHVSFDEIGLRYTTTVLLDILSVGCALNFDDLVNVWGEPDTLDAWKSSQWSL